jgi:hypothetical protein
MRSTAADDLLTKLEALVNDQARSARARLPRLLLHAFGGGRTRRHRRRSSIL